MRLRTCIYITFASLSMASIGIAGTTKSEKGEVVEMSSGLKYQVLKPAPEGAPFPKKGDKVVVQYTGWLDDNGKEGKKLKRSNFKKFLLSVQELPMDEQQQALSKMFDDWKTGFEQVDDVCVTGIRI